MVRLSFNSAEAAYINVFLEPGAAKNAFCRQVSGASSAQQHGLAPISRIAFMPTEVRFLPVAARTIGGTGRLRVLQRAQYQEKR